MEGFNLKFVVCKAMMVATMQFRGSMAQTRHVVGDALGWTIPLSDAIAYTTWAYLQTSTIGDTLVFNFTNGQHDVAEVSEATYGSCTATNPISLATTGPTTLALTTPGTYYYICTVTSHCQIGQKLTINIFAATTAAPPLVTPITPTSPPTITPTPSSATPTTTMPSAPCPPTLSPNSSPCPIGSSTPPPPTSGASTFTAMAYVTFLTIALAFLNY